jgi:hypothetical protein
LGDNKKRRASKLVCFVVDGVIAFYGLNIGVIMQMMQKHAPFMMGIIFRAHFHNFDI